MPTEIERGWLLLNGRRESRALGESVSYTVYSLGVTTEGEPRFVAWVERTHGTAAPREALVRGPLEFGKPPHIKIGPIDGADLRTTIIDVLRLKPEHFPGVQKRQTYRPSVEQRLPGEPLYVVPSGVHVDGEDARRHLPRYIAQAMARCIDEAMSMERTVPPSS